MKKIIRQVLGTVSVMAVLVGSASANYQYNYSTQPTYGTNYSYGSYNYGQGYGQSSYQSSYYGQGYGNYHQGYTGYYGGGYGSGMGNQFAYVDNNWIEDQLRFAVTDVNQNRPYAAMQKLQQLSTYVQGHGDSELFRRLQLAQQLGYKSSLKNEINGIFNDWKAGKMRLGWESGSNQSYQGQDDISESYILGQLQLVVQDLNGKQQNRARQRLSALQHAIPPLGNERLVRRVYYAATVNRPSQMTSEVQQLMSEIRDGSLVLNDTENNPYNYYYGSGTTSPYGQPDYGNGLTGGPQTQPPFPGNGGLPGGGDRYGQPDPYNPPVMNPIGTQPPLVSNPIAPAPGPGTINYPTNTGGTVDYTNTQYTPAQSGSTATGNTGQTGGTTAAPAAPVADLAQLKANVAAAYSELKQALVSADREKITAAQQKYKDAQVAYEAAKNQ